MAVTPQPLREPFSKPWIAQPIVPPATEPYEPTDADRARYAQERQQTMRDLLRQQYQSLAQDGYDTTQLASYHTLFQTATT